MNLENIVAVRGSETVCREGDRAVRVFGEGRTKSDVFSEAHKQTLAEECGLNVARVEEVTRVSGRWAIVSEYIEGRTLGMLMEEEPEHRELYLEKLVRLQLDILAHRPPMLPMLKETLDRDISATGLSAVARFDLHARLSRMPEGDRLCHGDLSPSNIVVRPDGRAFVTGWRQAASGDPAADAAKTLLLFFLRGEDERAEQYLGLFCRASGISAQKVRGWLPIIAAARSAGASPAEREYLLNRAAAEDME